ncbi:MAG: hypothetical protein J6C13_02235 [Clostridia bacterium]|nr:hypothetical protein [Clostridia bacterium]
MGFWKDYNSLKKNKEQLAEDIYNEIIDYYKADNFKETKEISDYEIRKYIKAIGFDIYGAKKREIKTIRKNNQIGINGIHGVYGAIPVGFASVLISLYFVDSLKKDLHSEEINQAVLEYTTPKTEELNAKYDVLNVTPDGLAQQLEKVYNDCHISSGFGNVVVKDGYENFYVDYKNTNGFGVEDAITDITHEITNFTETLCFGVGTCAITTMLCLYPVFKDCLIRKQIKLYERELIKCSNLAKDKAIEYIRNDIKSSKNAQQMEK